MPGDSGKSGTIQSIGRLQGQARCKDGSSNPLDHSRRRMPSTSLLAHQLEWNEARTASRS